MWLHFWRKKHCIQKLIRIAIPDCFVEHGSVGELKKALGLDADSVTEKILAELPEEL